LRKLCPAGTDERALQRGEESHTFHKREEIICCDNNSRSRSLRKIASLWLLVLLLQDNEPTDHTRPDQVKALSSSFLSPVSLNLFDKAILELKIDT
jgi:hypothetical protein